MAKPEWVPVEQRLARALSNVGTDQQGHQFEYVGRIGLGSTAYRMIRDKASWEAIEAHFEGRTDAAGRSMLDLCRRYWDDPEYRAQINREIAEGRARRGKR